MSRTQVYRGALEAIDRVLNRGGGADDVLRAVVAILRERARYGWTAIAFLEDGRLVLGPEAGNAGDDLTSTPVIFDGVQVAAIQVAPPAADEEERAFLARVALVVSPYCLVGSGT